MSQKNQWKIAGALVGVFVVLVSYKAGIIGPGTDDAIAMAAKVSDPVQNRNVDAAEIITFLESSQLKKISVRDSQSDFVPVTRDPFYSIENRPPSLGADPSNAHGDEISNQMISTESFGHPRISREETLGGMSVTAIFSTAEWSKAVINGEYLGIGEIIQGFTVVEIGKRHVVIEDHDGKESLTQSNAFDYSRNSSANSTVEKEPIS
jgi:hypothetical protein